jgi:fructose-bisphosphate aldolase class II
MSKPSGSSLPFEENVAKTKEIVAYAHERNVTVEAEIGHVGEGDSYHVEGNTMLTTPEEAKKFVELTDVDSLAVSIGTAHGEYKGTPHLNFERLQEIAAEVSVPLVLHGGSGSGDENLSKAVELGICKVNICTDLLNAARDNTKDGYAERSYYDSVTLAKDGFKDCLKHYYEVFHTK